MDPAALWDLEAKRDVDLDAIYGRGTMDLRSEARALVLLCWRRAGAGFALERLPPAAALERLDIFGKSLGAFDLDRVPGAEPSAAEMDGYAAVLAVTPIFEVTGRVDFRALVGAVSALLAT